MIAPPQSDTEAGRVRSEALPALRGSLADYLAADRAYQEFVQCLAERGSRPVGEDALRLDDLRCNRDFALQVRNDHLCRLGWRPIG